MEVGQKVRIIDCKHGHRLEIGDIGIIEQIAGGFPEYRVMADGDWWWLSEDEMEIYNEPISSSTIVYYSAVGLVSLLIGMLSCMHFNIFLGLVMAGSVFYCLKVCTREI
jgi:hypothetical protein